MIFIGSDHAGFELKARLLTYLQSKGIAVGDKGTNSSESCDYPQFAKVVCDAVLANPGSLGLLICGSGIGMSIAANKVRGIRAAVVSDPISARLSREHNDCQVLCLGARIISAEKAIECLEAFLGAKFDTQNPRHQRRVDQMSEMEKGK